MRWWPGASSGTGEPPPPSAPPSPPPPPAPLEPGEVLPQGGGGGGDGRPCWCNLPARLVVASTGERIGVAYYACAQRSGQAGCSHQHGFLGWVDYPRPDRNPTNNPIYRAYDDTAAQPEEEQGSDAMGELGSRPDTLTTIPTSGSTVGDYIQVEPEGEAPAGASPDVASSTNTTRLAGQSPPSGRERLMALFGRPAPTGKTPPRSDGSQSPVPPSTPSSSQAFWTGVEGRETGARAPPLGTYVPPPRPVTPVVPAPTLTEPVVVGGAPEEMETAPSTEDPEGYSRMTRHALENLCAGRHIQFSLDLKGRQRQKLIDALIQYDREKEREGARLHREMILETDYGGEFR